MPTTKKNTKSKKTKTTKKIVNAKIDSVFKLTKTTAVILWQNRKLFAGVLLIYAIAYFVLVRALSSPTSVTSAKNDFSSVFHGHLAKIYSGISVFTFLLGTSASTASPSGGAYQVFLFILVGLAIIWSLRQVYSGVNIRVRDAYYKGLYPLVPYVLILLFLAIELLPLILGLVLYNLVFVNGIAVLLAEKLIWGLIILLLALISFYLISSSIFALFVVTLPDMTPMKALRSAKGLVKKRRLLVLGRVIYLPIMLGIILGLIMLPVILLLASAAAWIFFFLSLIALLFGYAYLYNLYRNLLNE